MSVHRRPVPATCHGCATQAVRNRAAALARAGARPWPVPNRAKANASLCNGIAQVGAEQPSMPRHACDSVAPLTFWIVVRTSLCTG